MDRSFLGRQGANKEATYQTSLTTAIVTVLCGLKGRRKKSSKDREGRLGRRWEASRERRSRGDGRKDGWLSRGGDVVDATAVGGGYCEVAGGCPGGFRVGAPWLVQVLRANWELPADVRCRVSEKPTCRDGGLTARSPSQCSTWRETFFVGRKTESFPVTPTITTSSLFAHARHRASHRKEPCSPDSHTFFDSSKLHRRNGFRKRW